MRNVICLVSVMLVVTVGDVFGGTYSGGTGTAEYPFLISDSNDLLELSNSSTDWGNHFVMTGDIDLTGVSVSPIGYDEDNFFAGSFDGNGFRIINLTMNLYVTSPVALFLKLGDTGKIQNLGLEQVDIDGVYVVGGLIGENYGIVSNCNVTGTVDGYNVVGGLAGYNYGVITGCYSSVSVTGNRWVGGLVGRNDRRSPNNAIITNCYATGAVSGEDYVGGLLGYTRDGKIANCYSTGIVSGEERVGGLIGAASSNPPYRNNATNCFWDIETSGKSTSGGGLGLSTAEMKSLLTYSHFGWGGEVWTVPSGDYPHLSWEEAGGEYISDPVVMLEGIGSLEEPWLIRSAEELAIIGLGSYFWEKFYVLMNDIDLMGISVNRIGYDSTNGFIGSFDGNGHVISNLTLNLLSKDFVGLFGCIGEGGQVHNLGLAEYHVTGYKYVGGLAGRNNGTITKCFSIGTVSGNDTFGGLVGDNESGIIDSCYSDVLAIGGDGVGGLTGSNIGTMRNCYATGAVSGGNRVHGLAGYNRGPVSSCFFDVQVSGESGTIAGLNLSTSQMQEAVTYSLNGWGGDEWTIVEGEYPRLAWEGAGGDLIGDPVVTLEGSGTAQYPWILRSAEDHVLIGQGSYYWDKHYVLINDIDLSGFSLNRIGYDQGNAFVGSFEGNGHSISNLTIDLVDFNYVGFFGCIGEGGHVRNVSLVDADTIGHIYVGTLAGGNFGTVTNCYATGSVWGQSRVGCLVGYNFSGSSIINCFVEGTVTGEEAVGGLSGHNNGTIRECNAIGEVSGDTYVGGLVGYNVFGTIMNCHAMCSLSGYEYVGGLIGLNSSSDITNCYSIGTVSGHASVGGLVGYNQGGINNCYAKGSVIGDTSVGGLVGGNNDTILNSYAAASVSGDTSVGGVVGYCSVGSELVDCRSESVVVGGNQVGGLAGETEGMVLRCSAEGDVEGVGEVGGLIGSNTGTVGLSYAAGGVSGGEAVGGFVGGNTGHNVGVIEDCYALGDVSGENQVGGFAGVNWLGQIDMCFSSGIVGVVGGSENAGGLIGYDTDGTYESTFWDATVNPGLNGIGNDSDQNVIGEVTENLQRQATFVDGGWDFVGETDNGEADVWRICVDGVGYPRFSWEFGGDYYCPDGIGVEDLVYLCERWLEEGLEPFTSADRTGDGVVGFEDFGVLADEWLGD